MSLSDKIVEGKLVGNLSKMTVVFADPVIYTLIIGDDSLAMNDLIGRHLSLEYLGVIHCSYCGRQTKKSFNQGFCYPCFRRLPQCDICIMRPEKCHYDKGTCRDASWGDKFCMNEHIVYLANSSGIKVGITRATQVPVRWIDQGATQALPLIRVSTRYQSGVLESLLKEFVSDRTNWRKMLQGQAKPIDMKYAAAELLGLNQSRIDAFQKEFGINAIQPIVNAEEWKFQYPVKQHPVKVISQSFDKTLIIEGVLMGIKGQYLILDTGVFNIRKHTSYQVKISVR